MWNRHLALKLTSCTIVKNRQDACSPRDEFYCGTGILPVPKQVIENGATSQLKPTQVVISILKIRVTHIFWANSIQKQL
ncbi:hypothetical protein D0A37_17685 [Microcoleus vaginatus HSN003]|nr:hypothetical protein D0A37_17685 [Microcoleus vaginatus HSN003]